MFFRGLAGALAGVGCIVAALPAAAQTADDFYPTEESGEVAPMPPAGAAAGLKLPERRADGGFDTPSADVPALAKAWHLRAALNVAALGCRDAREAQTVAAYNAMLAGKRTALAAADTALRQQFRQRYGAQWTGYHDSAMTRLYNFYAQPGAHEDFCATAQRVLDRVGTMSEAEFIAAAPEALAAVEAPFVAFYDAYDRYRAAFAQWRARHDGPQVVVASSAPVSPQGIALAPR